MKAYEVSHTYGNLVCISVSGAFDQNETLLFATVSWADVKVLEKTCVLLLQEHTSSTAAKQQ